MNLRSIIGIIILAIFGLIAVSIGAAMATYFFLGLIMFAGFLALCESIDLLKYVVAKGSKVFDLTLFILSVMATISFGVTVAAALTVAGLIYSLVYAPYLRSSYKKSFRLIFRGRVPYGYSIK